MNEKLKQDHLDAIRNEVDENATLDSAKASVFITIEHLKWFAEWLREMFTAGDLGIGTQHFDIAGKIKTAEQLIQLYFNSFTDKQK